MEETRWWLVRHAPVKDTARIYGQHDVDCDCGDAGVFAALARHLPRGAVWLTTHLNRTHQTAAAIVAALADRAHAPAPPVAVPELAEQNLGAWQGTERKSFFSSQGRTPRPFWFAPASERAPGGESFADVVERVRPTLMRLTAEHRGRDIVAVVHGGTVKAALAVVLSLDPEAALAFVINNCSITRLDHLADGADDHWRIGAVNHRPWSADHAPASDHHPTRDGPTAIG